MRDLFWMSLLSGGVSAALLSCMVFLLLTYKASFTVVTPNEVKIGQRLCIVHNGVRKFYMDRVICNDYEEFKYDLTDECKCSTK